MLVRREARSALVSLCENHWYPLYAYLRRRGYPPGQALDLTQEFFIRVLEGRYLDRAHPEKGRFRSFLLSSLKFLVAEVEVRGRTHQRGGGALVPLVGSSAERPLQGAPVAIVRLGVIKDRVLSGDPCSVSSQDGSARAGTRLKLLLAQ
jgi:DNA-directed RNA polymerase specialized sigma24 family protein